LKAVVLSGPRRVKVLNVDMPKTTANDVLIRVKAAGICGTDLISYRGSRYQPLLKKSIQNFPKYLGPYVPQFLRRKKVLGHEFSGTVEKKGKHVNHVELGEKVTAWPIMSCNKCEACRIGLKHLCEHEREWPGAFSEFIKVPLDNLIRIPAQLSFEEAVLLEPLAAVLHATRLADINPQDSIAILGAGTIGLLLMQVAKSLGVREIAITDVYNFPLQVAKKLGADRVINASEVKNKEIGYVDITFECVGGSAPTIKQAFEVTSCHGKIILLGTFAFPQSIDMFKFRRKEFVLIGSNGSQKHDFSDAIKLLIDGKVKVKPLITHVFPFSKASEAFDTALKKEETNSIKVELISEPEI